MLTTQESRGYFVQFNSFRLCSEYHWVLTARVKVSAFLGMEAIMPSGSNNPGALVTCAR